MMFPQIEIGLRQGSRETLASCFDRSLGRHLPVKLPYVIRQTPNANRILLVREAQSALNLKSGRTGKDEFDSIYHSNLEDEAEWLRIGAKQKVDSIERLIARNSLAPNSILELGCGTGAVIGEIRRRGIGTRWFGVDSSEAAIEYLSSHDSQVLCRVADVTSDPDPFGVERYDLVVVSHVIEHLETPESFLQKATKQLSFSHLIAEVPLENLFFGRLKSRFRDRAKNDAGHVQFFDGSTFTALLERSGLRILDEYRYAPWFELDTIRHQNASSIIARSYRTVTQHAAPRYMSSLYQRFYHAHLAVLCDVPSGLEVLPDQTKRGDA